MKLLAFLIPFFLSSVVFGISSYQKKCETPEYSEFKWMDMTEKVDLIGDKKLKQSFIQDYLLGNTHGCFDKDQENLQDCDHPFYFTNLQTKTLLCIVPLKKLVPPEHVTKGSFLTQWYQDCVELEGTFAYEEDTLTDLETINSSRGKGMDELCTKSEAHTECLKRNENLSEEEKSRPWKWTKIGCQQKEKPECQKLKNPHQDCSPERGEAMTDLFIQGLGFVSAQSGNTCIALAIQSFPQTKAYSSAVKKCTKQKKEACKSVNGKPQCKSCDKYKKQLEHVKAESLKMLAGYKQAVDCAQQTKTDYKGSAEECNVINAFNRDKCCFMPEHMNTPLCDDFGSEHAFSPNLGYTDKKRIGGGESIDYGGDELPFVHSPSKFDPKKDPILNSPLSPDSGSSIGGGGGAGGSPYTNSDSALGLSRKGAFQTYIQGGGGSRLGKSSSKNKSYPYALSSFERKKLKYKNKNNKKGKATIRSLASKRNRTIFEKISDVYTSLINKRKLFFKGDGAQK